MLHSSILFVLFIIVRIVFLNDFIDSVVWVFIKQLTSFQQHILNNKTFIADLLGLKMMSLKMARLRRSREVPGTGCCTTASWMSISLVAEGRTRSAVRG